MTRIQSAYQAQLRHQADLLRRRADILPHGKTRDALLLQAQGLERTAILEGWVSCSELQPLKGRANDSRDKPDVDAGPDRRA